MLHADPFLELHDLPEARSADLVPVEPADELLVVEDLHPVAPEFDGFAAPFAASLILRMLLLVEQCAVQYLVYLAVGFA